MCYQESPYLLSSHGLHWKGVTEGVCKEECARVIEREGGRTGKERKSVSNWLFLLFLFFPPACTFTSSVMWPSGSLCRFCWFQKGLHRTCSVSWSYYLRTTLHCIFPTMFNQIDDVRWWWSANITLSQVKCQCQCYPFKRLWLLLFVVAG